MQFCPKCGRLMFPKRIEEETVLMCDACGCTVKGKLGEYKITKPGREEKVRVVEETKPTLPTTKVKCPRCGHKVAYWWLRQTRAADEALTRFYRCTGCGHTWREY